MIAQAVAAVVVALAAATGVQTWRLHSLQADIAAERGAAVELARTTERQMAARNREIDRAQDARARATRTAAAADLAVADSVRDDLAAYTRDAAPTPGCADVEAARDRLAGLLAEGARLVAEGQGRGGDVADQVIGLQDHAPTVCAPAPTNAGNS